MECTKKTISPQVGFKKEALDLKSSFLPNKLKRYPSSASLEQVNPQKPAISKMLYAPHQ